MNRCLPILSSEDRNIFAVRTAFYSDTVQKPVLFRTLYKWIHLFGLHRILPGERKTVSLPINLQNLIRDLFQQFMSLYNMLQKYIVYQTAKPPLMVSIMCAPYDSSYGDVNTQVHTFYMSYMRWVGYIYIVTTFILGKFLTVSSCREAEWTKSLNISCPVASFWAFTELLLNRLDYYALEGEKFVTTFRGTWCFSLQRDLFSFTWLLRRIGGGNVLITLRYRQGCGCLSSWIPRCKYLIPYTSVPCIHSSDSVALIDYNSCKLRILSTHSLISISWAATWIYITQPATGFSTFLRNAGTDLQTCMLQET
jgi:hypothetical protein